MQPLMPPQAQAGYEPVGMMPPQAQAGFGMMPPQAQAGFGQMPPQAQAGMGASPDGLGAYLSEPGGQVLDQTATTHYYPEQQMQGPIPWLEPTDTSAQATVQSAGYTALLVAVTTGVGLAWARGWGAVAGFTLGAALANGYRAQKDINSPDPSRRHEAVVSGTIGLGELIIFGYSTYRAAQSRKEA